MQSPPGMEQGLESPIDVLLQQVQEHEQTLQVAPLADEEPSDVHRQATIEDLLSTDPQVGLSDSQVAQREHLFGPNELFENRVNYFKKFVSYFVGPIQFVMEVTAILAAGLQLWIDLGVICAMLMLNACVGFFQECQAESVVAELKTSMALTATVVRGGIVLEVNASALVPGDIVLLAPGTIIPADGYILASGPEEQEAVLLVDQSTITGESQPIDKRASAGLYSSSVVRTGRARMIVTDIGDRTFIGRTAALVNKTERIGHFAAVLQEIGVVLLVIAVIFVTIVLIIGFFRSASAVSLLTYVFVIGVVGVPVGLPTVVTTTLAVGAADLAKSKAVVKKLASIEGLAGVDVLCSDKTGTLTLNRLSISEPFCLQDCDPDRLIFAAACTCARTIRALDPIDRAILVGLSDYPHALESFRSTHITDFVPFDPVSKRASATINADPPMMFTKGAAHAVIESAQPLANPEEIDALEEHVNILASRGLRALAVAEREGNDAWRLLGLVPLHDPLRPDAASTVSEAQKLGLQVKILTGDSVEIAREVARQLGLRDSIQTASSMEFLSDAQMAESDGFAQVFPEHKYKVVAALQQQGHLVAMTGDGVNDAPSLKRADAGIAVEGATSAARAAADIVLLRPGLAAIVKALKTSRKIFQRMRAYIIYRVALSLHLEIYFVTALAILGYFLNVVLVAFLAIFSDIATLAIAYDRASYSLQPARWSLGEIWFFATVLGFSLAVGTWIINGVLLATGTRVAAYGSAQGIIFLEIALSQSWLILISRYSVRFEKMTWPSLQLVGAILFVDILATLFCIFGWWCGTTTSIVAVVFVWMYSAGITVVLFLVFYLMNHAIIFKKPEP